jgi:hypothetical protein
LPAALANPKGGGIGRREALHCEVALFKVSVSTITVTPNVPVEQRRSLRIGIVGHRYLRSAETFVERHCRAILRRAQRRYCAVTALSALAEGSDSLFAEAAIDLGIPLVIVRPFDEYVLDFQSSSARTRYLRLRELAANEVLLEYRQRSEHAYVAAMEWVVFNSDVLLAAWDGMPAAGRGGTGDAVEQAARHRRVWVHLNVAKRSIILNSPARVEPARGGWDQ